MPLLNLQFSIFLAHAVDKKRCLICVGRETEALHLVSSPFTVAISLLNALHNVLQLKISLEKGQISMWFFSVSRA